MTPDILEMIKEIMEHVTVLNDDYTELSKNLAILTERVEWLCKFFWVIVSAVVGLVATQIWQLIILGKNNKK